MTIGRTPHEEGSQPAIAISHHSWFPLLFSDLSLIRDRVIFRKPSSSPTKQTICYDKIYYKLFIANIKTGIQPETMGLNV